MSRIQNILEKAEREGTAMRTGRMAPPPVVAAHPAITIDMAAPPAPPALAPVAPAMIVPGSPSMQVPPAPAVVSPTGAAAASAVDAVAHFAVRLNPLLVASLAPTSLAAEQYRTLRTRIAFAEGAGALRTVLITSPQKGEGKSLTAANLALTMAQEL